MKYISLLLFLCLRPGLLLFAQNETVKKIATEVSKDELKKSLYYLCSDPLEGRLMATRGDTLASMYIANSFQQSKLDPAFTGWNGFYQPVVYNRKEFPNPAFIVGNKTYNNWDGWYFNRSSMESTQLENIPVVFAGYNIENEKYSDYANLDVKGKAVLVISGQPKDSATGIYHLTGTRTPAPLQGMLTKLKEKGAVLLMVMDQRFDNNRTALQKTLYRPVFINNLNPPPAMVLPVLTISEQRANEILSADNLTVRELQRNIDKEFKPHSFAVKNTVSAHIILQPVPTTAPNVVGMIKGSDPTAGYIIVSAHHDHEGKSPEGIYYGAVDNASGTAAIMEIARLMNKAVEKGQRPKRTIVFASYTGEERGLLGSYYLAAHPVYPIERTWAVLNIDMMGRVDTFYSGKRPDSSYAYILVKDTLNRNLRTAVFDANDASGNRLRLDTWYEQPQFMNRRLTGSDQYPFYVKGIPFVRIDCGFCIDYHQRTDTPDKINYDLLQKQVQLAFLTAWNLAN